MTNRSIHGAVLATLGALALAGCAPTTGTDTLPPASTQVAANDPDYADGDNWLCLPGRDDACAVDLDTAVIAADGTVSVEEFTPAADPEFDCFYVYPTVSLDESINSDMTAGPEELSVVAAQFARFGSKCRTFAPLYRQVTLATLRNVMAEAAVHPARASLAEEPRNMAFADVKRAWAEYLNHHNNGRGVILIGHSQGADMLKRLVAQEIEGSPIADRMIAAYLIGFNVTVPEGKLVGGEFSSTPLCTASDQTGCIVAYSSFAEGSPPGPASLFGRSYAEGMEIACVNPAAPGSDAAQPLDAYLSNLPATAASWIDGQSLSQRFVKLPGAITGQCVSTGGAQYLDIARDPGPSRKTPSFGPIADNPALAPMWGLHVVDMHVGMGDLVKLAGTQGAAYVARQ